MKTKNMIIIPLGNLANMILVMLSAIVFCKHKNMNILMIWKHKIPFDNLFLDGIQLVNESFLNGKRYIYNPAIDQSLMYNNTIVCDTDEYMVIETNKLIKANTMSDITILKNMQMIYKELLREHISGILLGQINMIDFPKSEFIYDFNDKNNVLNFENMFDTNNQDFIDYIKILSISKASIVKCNPKHIELNLSDIYHISIINFNMIVCKDEIDIKQYVKEEIFSNFTENFLGYHLVINANIQKMMLLL